MILIVCVIVIIISAIIVAGFEYYRYRIRKRHAEIWRETTDLYLGFIESLNEECNAEIDISPEFVEEVREILKPDKEIK